MTRLVSFGPSTSFISWRGPALHVDDRLVAVFSVRGRGQAQNISCRNFLQDGFKRNSRQMMALIDDDLPIPRQYFFWIFEFCEGRKHPDVDFKSLFLAGATKNTNPLRIKLQEGGNLAAPLFQ